MRILITNDDGWGAGGILSLVKVMRQLGEVIVLAPDGPRSGQSNAITTDSPIRIKQVLNEPGLAVYTCNGTPTDCVKAAFYTVFKDAKPDLVCSGINHGDNGSINVIYSGTMGAVLEGCTHDVLSIGFSLSDYSHEADFSLFEPYILRITKRLLELPRKENLCWNINAPKGEIKGVRLTRQCRGYWDKEFQPYTDPGGQTFYLLTGRFVNAEPDSPDTDQFANAHGFVSVTPTTIDLTDYECLNTINIGLE